MRKIILSVLLILMSIQGYSSKKIAFPGFEEFEYLGETPVLLHTYKDSEGQIIWILEEKENTVYFSPGCRGISTCITSISYVDGKKCELFYRQYPIDELVEKYTYPQIAHMLLYKSDPSITNSKVIQCLNLPEATQRFCEILSVDMDPLIGMQMGVLQWSNQFNTDEDIPTVLGMMPTLFAYMYRHSKKLAYIGPLEKLSYAENVLYMMYGEEFLSHSKRPVLSRMLDKLLNLHAEHGTNASTSTVRNMRSTGSSYLQCLSGAIGTLSGSKHGGANRAALEMYENKIISIERVPNFIEAVRERKEIFMGMGHRVYDGDDPRYTLLNEGAQTFWKEMGMTPPPLFSVAQEALEQAKKDEFFASRGIYPNIDALSGFFMEAIGIPKEMFTALFALGRMGGWTAHYLEEKGPIFRPLTVVNRGRKILQN